MEAKDEVEELAKFIIKYSSNLPLAKFTLDQIKCYVLEKINLNTLRVAYDRNGAIIGAVMFQARNQRGEFHIEQLWCSCEEGLRLLLLCCLRDYPEVKELHYYRHKKRKFLKIKLESLLKFYGRRSSTDTE